MKKDTKDKGTKDKKDSSQKEIEELTDQLKRVQAEFINYKNRIENEKSEFADYIRAEFTAKLIPLLDNFEIALNSCDKNTSVFKGMEMIYAQLFDILSREGLEKIDSLNKPFNPKFHDAVLSEKSEKPKNTIIEELQKGYLFKGKVIRHTKVKVSKK